MKFHLRSFAFLLFLCAVTICSSAQISTYSSDTNRALGIQSPQYHRPPVKTIIKRPKPIQHEFSFGARLNTDGWSIFVDKGKVNSEDEKHSDMFYNIKLWQFEFGEKKNPKEVKSTNTQLDPYSGDKPTPFIYGKINNFYTFKIGYGFRKMIAGKPDPGTVSIHWVGAGGLAVGLLKPYYINAIVNNSPETLKYSDSNSSAFLSQTNIVGSAGFSKGLSEIKVIPGLQAKTGLHFDFSTNRKTVLAVETGINGELYTQKVPLMANQKAVPYFVDLYLSFQFGKRW